MTAVSCSLESMRTAFSEQARSFLDAADGIDELDLLDASLCRGWSRLDTVVHVRIGLEEMAAACGVHATGPVDHDAVTYWRSFSDQTATDPVPHILWLKRLATAYAKPSSAVRHLADVVERCIGAVAGMTDRPVAFQGKNLPAGDFVATWVVELAIHQLDLAVTGVPPSCGLVRATIEALAGTTLPGGMDDPTAILTGLGRIPWPEDHPRDEALPIQL